ncbi:MAG: protein kinase [Phycisphaeraceae bacterium]
MLEHSVEIHCPSCRYHIVIKGAKPGGYRPACPQCKQNFVMVVALVDHHRLVLLGESLETLAPVRGLERLAPASAQQAVAAGASPAEPGPDGAVTVAGPPPVSGRHDGSGDATVTAQAEAPASRASNVGHQTVSHQGAAQADVTRTRATFAQPPASVVAAIELPARLDGYELTELLGRGGMGSVYLARQLSLDRLVAIKTINPEWAGDPVFLSRFTREAFAAAQLTHHNVVQIHDIGDDAETHFFSMEYVDGRSLADLIAETGKLDVEQAAGYILHAARGLRFAHDHGMVHRDIKPANLLINDEGVVKVADLGLVKTADESGLTRAGGPAHPGTTSSALTSPTTMGTPAYIAPEQITDPSQVDARADIYSLGCTFYALVTGRPVFQGNTAEEVMSKHATETVVPPEQVARRVPPAVSQIILKMVAKSPDDRLASMRDVIEQLERFLGIAAGPFTPREEHARTLEEAVQGFYASPLAQVRRALVIAFSVACMAVAGWGLVASRPTWVILAAGLWLFTVVSYAVLTGVLEKTAVAGKVRQLVLGVSVRDWVFWPIVLAALVGVLVLLDLHLLMLGTLAGGMALAALFYFGVDWPVARQREPHVAAVRQMLKQLRLRGLEEEAVRRFVCRYSGRQWEAFYETLFGYEAKLIARRHWGTDDQGRPRRKYGAWRDGLIQWIDRREEQREQARRQKLLHRIEVRRARAEGKTEWEARWEAETVSHSMIARAEHYKQTGDWQGAAAKAAEQVDRPTRPGLGRRLIRLVPGARSRLAAGAVLLMVYVTWLRDQGLLQPLEEGRSLFAHGRALINQQPPPLERAWLPIEIAPWLCTHATGLAGLVLAMSVFFGGRKVTLWMVPAVLFLLLAPLLPIPSLQQFSAVELTLALGVLLAWAGIWVGRRS